MPTLDCPNEEAEIRRTVENIAGIRALTFQLGQRTMTLDALPEVIEQAVAAIRKAGFDPRAVPDKGRVPRSDADAVRPDEDDHGAGSIGAWRLGSALLFAIGAEMLGFFAPDTQAWTAAGLALSAYSADRGHPFQADRGQRSVRSRTPLRGYLSDGTDDKSSVRDERGTLSAISVDRGLPGYPRGASAPGG